LKVAPATRKPFAIAMPLKSNILTYGPWYSQGAAGKVRFESDPALTPWAYGGYASMNQAAAARVNTTITNMQVSEAGDVERAGAPEISLGDVLQSSGPNLTGMSVQCNQQGVTTTYRFQTYTPRFGTFSKSYIERLKRYSLVNVELRRNLRNAIKEAVNNIEVIGNAARTAEAFRAKQAKAHKRETPHDVLHAYSEAERQTDGSIRVRTHVSATTMEESVVMSNADDNGLFKATAVMGLSGLVRPFTTKVGGASGIPGYVTPTTTSGLTKNILDPWKWNNDIEVWMWGDQYDGLHAYGMSGTTSNARALGLRAPIVLVGWGIDVETKCVPGSGSTRDTWLANAQYRQDQWKAGPLDPLWDERRGVWTVHGSLKGTVRHVPAGGSGVMVVKPLSGSTWEVPVWNWFSAAVGSSGGAEVKVLTTYIAADNRHYIAAADCS
jgi:hypothetical protein